LGEVREGGREEEEKVDGRRRKGWMMDALKTEQNIGSFTHVAVCC
jgi:hypothetical protein